MTDMLWQSFANCHSASEEAEALQEAIETAVAECALGQVRQSDDEWTYSYGPDEGEGWLTSYSVQSIRIREVGLPARARGTLSIGISFYRPEDRAGDDWPGGRRAKLYVGVAPTPKAWDADSLLVDGSGRSEIVAPVSSYRWGRPSSSDAWFFCLALDAIDSREALTRDVMGPLRTLLAGGDEQTAFAECRSLIAPPAANLSVPSGQPS